MTAAQRFWERLRTAFTGADVVAVADDMVAGGLARKDVVGGETVWVGGTPYPGRACPAGGIGLGILPPYFPDSRHPYSGYGPG
jgi:hypothetical protein